MIRQSSRLFILIYKETSFLQFKHLKDNGCLFNKIYDVRGFFYLAVFLSQIL